MTTARYRVRLDPPRQQLEIELRLSGHGAGPLRLELPTWVPGAYGYLKYGRDLFDVRAFEAGSGRELEVVRAGWSGFVVEAASGETTLRYRALACDPAWGELAGVLDHRQAVLLGTRYLSSPAHRGPCRVTYVLPENWAFHHPAGAREVEPGTFEYPDFAALLDTPVVAGAFDLRTRESHGVRFEHVFLDRTFGFDTELDGFLDAVMAVADAAHAIFGSFPFERYTFVYSFSPTAHWGLEHANATMIALDATALVDDAAWFRAVRVAAHELFHAWNVCRLKPSGLMSSGGDGTNDGLWVSEGFTRWYEFLLCVRAGELAPEALLANVVNYWRHLTALPAYARTTAADSSLATFLNHNRYPGSVNATVDYYDLGLLVAFDLDAALRLRGGSLDVEFAAFYEAHVATGFTTADVRRFFDARHPGLGDQLRTEVEAAGRLSTLEQLERLGFTVTRTDVRHLGLVLAENKGPVVASVLDTGPAARAGVAAGDELVRLDGLPFQLDALKWLISRGNSVAVEVKRGPHRFTFEVVPAPREDVTGFAFTGDDRQLERLRGWFGRPEFAPAAGVALPLAAYDNFHGIQTVL